MPSPDGKTLFLQLGTLYGPPSIKAEARFTAVFDVSNPARPQQLASIPVGGGSATRDHALTGDGKLLVVPNAVENSVTVIDVADRKALRTFASVGGANRVVTYGAGAGPSKPVGPPAPATASN
jgi:DNA-binding beta-propeller fold protein YncE